MKRCIIIINPNSGRRKNINEFRIRKIFLKYGYESTIVYTEYKGHALEIASKMDTDLIISVGGDGTFNEVMTGNFLRKKRNLVAHIPVGTANDIGAMYGYSRSLYKNIELLLKGSIKKVDICTINDRPFTYVAALGKFTNISYDTPRKLKRDFGYLAYLIEGLKDLNNPTPLYEVDYYVDGVKYSGKFSCMLISNANRIAGINNFYKDIKLDDNRFEVLFCELKEKSEILKILYHLKDGDISKLDGFKFYKTSNLKLNFKEKIKKGFSVDGEELEDFNDEFEIKIIRGIELLIPNKNISKLFIEEKL